MQIRPLHIVNRAVPEQAVYTLRTHRLLAAQASLGLRPTCLVHPSKRIVPHANLEPPSVGIRIEDGVRYCRFTESRRLRRMAAQAAHWLRENKVRGSWRLKNLELRLPDDVWSPLISWAVKKNEFDVVHAHTPFWCATAGRRVADALRCPLIYEVRGFWELSAEAEGGHGTRQTNDAPKWQAHEMAAMESADAVITLSETMRAELIARGLPGERVHVVANGVDIGEFTPKGQKNERIVKELGLEGTFVLGYATSVRALEGVATVLRALAKLQKAARPVRFVLLGDGSELPRLKQEADELGIASMVRFLGRVHHAAVADYYSVFDAFVVPRIDAAVCRIVTPLKPLEAMAAGLPLIVSDLPALTEVLDDGRAGVSFLPEDPEDLAAKILLLASDEQRCKLMGHHGRQWVGQNRQWDRLARQTSELYEALLERHHLDRAMEPAS
ncbi:MAG: glycosyltransferase [Pirellulales bacterium]|nr:glycosyltransferase [Pirellulales bacterium]